MQEATQTHAAPFFLNTVLVLDFLVVKSVKLKFKLFKMREIKFRIWNTEEYYYTDPEHLGEYHFGIGKGIDNASKDKIYNTSEWVWQQFTGLKDKNGKEIYESDIVRILYTDWSSKSDSDPRTLEQYLIDISHVGQVVFNDNSWEVKKHSIKYNDFVFSSINHGKYGFIEVIGNIYENPELLS